MVQGFNGQLFTPLRFRRIRRTLATILITLFLSSLLAACLAQSREEESGESTASGTKVSESAGSPSETATESDTEPEETTGEATTESDAEPAQSTTEDDSDLITIGGETDMPIRIEAEDGKISGASLHRTVDGYSGSAYVGDFRDSGDSVEISFILEEAGHYNLSIGYYLPTDSGNKINSILVNGAYFAGQEFVAGDGFQESKVGLMMLDEGRNTIRFTKGENDWGWMYIDYFSLDLPDESDLIHYDVDPTLIDAQATPATVRLYDYLKSIYGKKMLTGQQLYFTEEAEIERLLELTGKKPAMKGYDFINQTEGGAFDDQVERAIRWVEDEGGLLTMCWHWWAPSGGRAFYTKDTTFDIREAVTVGTASYDLIIRDIDRIGGLLLDMQERGIPVIWRPLHEASGGWFWWGAHGAEPYKALWDILYERLVDHHGLHNLIWVVNGQHPDWYVGDDKNDIIGEDIYPGERVYSSYLPKFKEAYDTVGGRKIVALTENGVVPDIEEMKQSGAMWAWFMPWWGDFTTTDRYTEDDVFRTIYGHEDVITLDELPTDFYD